MKTDLPHTIYLKDYAPPPFLISACGLDVSLDPAATRVRSKLSLHRNPVSGTGNAAEKSLRLNGEKLDLVSVRVDGRLLDAGAYRATAADLTIDGVPDGPFTLEIETVCNPEANKALMGLYRSGGLYCTQCEPEGFRRITYYLDRPDVLATFRVRIEADKKLSPVLLSNGNLMESGDLKGGRHYAVWEDPFPKPSYLFALVAGKLGLLRDTFTTKSGRAVDLRIYADPGKEDRCGFAMESLKLAMKWDEDRFGLEYDLDIFMIAVVSDFNFGAMENKGLNIFNDALVLARPDTATDADYERIEAVIAHEYFHNWSGNRVTCRDWFQLCLKEGLTVFRDQEFTADVRSGVVKRIQDVRFLKTSQFREDAGPLAHPVRPASFMEINNFYTVTVYEKGGEICRMLQTMLGRDGFRKGLDLYFTRHDGQAVTVEDFISSMADANNADLGDFLNWYNQSGTPVLDARFVFSEANKSARLTLSQSYPQSVGGEKRKTVPIPVKLGLVANGKDLPLQVDGKPLESDTILLRKRKDVYTFDNVETRPALSILRDFSAPVHLALTISDREMLVLMRSDSDLFNRWQISQTFALNHLKEMTSAIERGEATRTNTRFIGALGEIAADAGLDHAYRAAVLTIPSEKDIALSIGHDVDPEAIHAARNALLAALGKGLRKVFETVYDASEPAEPYSPDAKNAGKRALRATVLGLLIAGGSRFAAAKAKALAQRATNMTETMSALASLSLVGDGAFDEAVGRFERKWKNEPLVMNKWFALQAGMPQSATLERVRKLRDHPLFSIQNPNRARSLYGVFAHGNQVRFNDSSGEGYELIADAIVEIDGFNPQVAARLCGAFEGWRLFEPKRQALALAALDRITAKEGLSRDTMEIAGKIARFDAAPNPADSA